MPSEAPPNPTGSSDPLESRLRALPRPPVPAGLEARLLAAAPARVPPPKRPRLALFAVASGLVAACLAVVLVRSGHEVETSPPRPATRPAVTHVPPRATAPAWLV